MVGDMQQEGGKKKLTLPGKQTCKPQENYRGERMRFFLSDLFPLIFGAHIAKHNLDPLLTKMFNFFGGLHLNLHDQLAVAEAKGIIQRLAKRCLD